MGFSEAQKFVAKWEGGLSNHPSDPGGLTNYGISLRFLRALGHDVDGDGDVDAADIQSLTPALSADLLKQEFWTCQDLDTFPRLTAIAHYDASVNCGRSRAVRLLQSACNAFPGPQVKEDGKLGPKTRARVAALNDAALAAKCIQARQDFYKRLVVSDPKFSAFSDGWMNRTADLSKYIREVADAPSVANVAPAQVKPAQPGVQIGPVHDVGKSPVADQEVVAAVPSNGPVTIGGIPLSKKLCVAIAALLAILLNSPLHLGMSGADIQDLVKLVSSYLLGQSAVDAFRPFVTVLLKGGKPDA